MGFTLFALEIPFACKRFLLTSRHFFVFPGKHVFTMYLLLFDHQSSVNCTMGDERVQQSSFRHRYQVRIRNESVPRKHKTRSCERKNESKSESRSFTEPEPVNLVKPFRIVTGPDPGGFIPPVNEFPQLNTSGDHPGPCRFIRQVKKVFSVPAGAMLDILVSKF